MSEQLGANLSEEQVGQIAGGALFGMVRALVDAGIPVNKALTLAAFLVIDGSAGRGAIEALGLGERQARRNRAQIRAVLADAPQEIPGRYVEEWAAAMQDRMRWAAKTEAKP